MENAGSESEGDAEAWRMKRGRCNVLCPNTKTPKENTTASTEPNEKDSITKTSWGNSPGNLSGRPGCTCSGREWPGRTLSDAGPVPGPIVWLVG